MDKRQKIIPKSKYDENFHEIREGLDFFYIPSLIKVIFFPKKSTSKFAINLALLTARMSIRHLYDFTLITQIHFFSKKTSSCSHFYAEKNYGPGFRSSNTLPPPLVILCAQYDIENFNFFMDQVVPTLLFYTCFIKF